MSFSNGDTVKVGSGKVEYIVRGENADGSVNVESTNTNKVQSVAQGRLVLVKAVVHEDPRTRAEWLVETGQREPTPKLDYLFSLPSPFGVKRVSQRVKGKRGGKLRTVR